MDIEQIKQSVLSFVSAPDYRPVKPKVIAKSLELDEEHTRLLKKAVKQLVKQGRLAYGANHLLGPPAAGAAGPNSVKNTVTGVFRRTERGFGFVRPNNAAVGHTKEQDIFISEKRARDAASGDVVLVRLRGKPHPSRGNPEGEIVEVVERDTHQFVGTYLVKDGSGYVKVDSTVFAEPIFVGDPGAKNARPDDKVVFEMVRFPTHLHSGEGVITEVLGPRGTPGMETISILREYGYAEHFPEDVMANGRGQADVFDESIEPGRRDLTADTIITIDPVDARDFDDAISLEMIDGGHWLLGVHIADVSHFVRPGTPLDREAKARATSVYLPDRVIPMLPEVISNSLASLQPDRVRYTKTAFIEYTPDGVFVEARFATTAIRSKRRFTYEEVDQYLADPEPWREKLTPEVHSLLGRMRDLARILRARRMKRGSLELSMPEVKVDLGQNGEVVGAHVVQNTESHQIIEEFMLAANDAVAEYLHAQELLFLRRVHLPPDTHKLRVLTEFVKELGFQVESLESRFELQRLLAEVRELPECHAVNYAVLRSLQRAQYSPAEAGHYALASDCYCHFTSPIRRYPDLTIHRLLDALLQHKRPVNNVDELVMLGQHCSDRERRAEEAERELTKVKLLMYLSERIGEELSGVITGVEEFGFFVQGVELPAEGLVHVNSLVDDYYHYDRRSHSLSGRKAGNAYRLGDRVSVTVARVDVDRRELDFRLVSRSKRPARPPQSPRKKKTDTKPKRTSKRGKRRK